MKIQILLIALLLTLLLAIPCLALDGQEVHEGKKVYLIKSVPKPGAPVVWGMQRLKIRKDGLMLQETFYDEEMQPVKKLSLSQIRDFDGKLYPKVWKMEKADAPQEYTLVEYQNLEFEISLPSQYFTLSNLRHPRR